MAGTAGTIVVALGGLTPDTALLRACLADARLLIAANGGTARLAALGLRPDLITGDLDSLSEAEREAAEAAGARIVAHPLPQEDTDGGVALRLAVQQGASALVVLGAHGGDRLDHSVGNLLAVFQPALAGISITLIDGWTEAWPLRAAGADVGAGFSGAPGDYASILPISEEITVSTSGLRWPLEQARLVRGDSRGISNELRHDRGRYVLHAGVALATHSFRQERLPNAARP